MTKMFKTKGNLAQGLHPLEILLNQKNLVTFGYVYIFGLKVFKIKGDLA